MNEASFQPLRPLDQRWLIEAELFGENHPNWTRIAVLAPTSGAAFSRATEVLGAEFKVLHIRRHHEINLDEEMELAARLSSTSPVVWTEPVWSKVHQADLPRALIVTSAPTPAKDARGIDLLPAALRESHGSDRIYAILDGAAVFGLRELLEGSGLPWKCLFQGEAAQQYANAAPYLIELRADNSLSRKLLRPVDAKVASGGASALEGGIFLSSPVSLDGLWRHLRKFTLLPDATQSKRIFFRFYDPQVFRTVVVNMMPEDIATFCTGIRAIAAVNIEGGFTLVSRQPEGL